MKRIILVWGMLFGYSLHSAEQQAAIMNVYNDLRQVYNTEMQGSDDIKNFLDTFCPLVLAHSFLIVDKTGKNLFCYSIIRKCYIFQILFFNRINQFNDETKKAILYQKDNDGNNALMLAVIHKQYNLAKQIFDVMYLLGADDPVHFLLEQNLRGFNVLVLSALYDQYYVSRKILFKIKDNIVLLRQVMEQINHENNNTVMLVFSHGNKTVVDYMIQVLKQLPSIRKICDQRNKRGRILFDIFENRPYGAARIYRLYNAAPPEIIDPLPDRPLAMTTHQEKRWSHNPYALNVLSARD